MRLCDVCKEPDPFKRQLAVGRITFERTDSEAKVPKYKSYDICAPCLARTVSSVLEREEV